MKLFLARHCVLSLFLFAGFFLKESDPTEEILQRVPVQSTGRVKPFESFAREVLLSVTGRTSFEGESATVTVWKWISQPEIWHTQSFLPIRYRPLRDEFPLMVIQGKISPELVLTHAPFGEEVNEALLKEKRKEFLIPIEKRRIELYDQARLFRSIAQGSLPGFFPNPRNPDQGWIPLSGLADPETRALLETEYPASALEAVQTALRELVEAFRNEAVSDRTPQAAKFARSLQQLLESRQIVLDETKINTEVFYNQAHFFQWAWMLYLAGAIFWFFSRGRLSFVPISFFASGFSAHTLGFILRCLIAGRPPVSNMYESVIWVAWAALLFSFVLGFVYRRLIVPASAAVVAALALLIGESFPAVLDPSLAPLVPVLRNNYWLTVHVLTITLSYGAFALAWGIAHASLFSFAFRPERTGEQDELTHYLYRALQIGVVLLAAGTILGGVWANVSWGRFWGWDPKETWALIALLGYLAVLHGRFAGWVGAFGLALGSVFAFLGILMAWYGVNFVLAAGLHSYGFGGGGLPYVLACVLLDLILVSFLAFRYHKNKIRAALS